MRRGMKMKKFMKSISWMVILCMLTAVMPAYAAGGDRVEISFCVGDDTLMINGEAVQVEKPYVVGVGVTLVPLRVITEAFGATVEWIAETETINLSYPEAEIVLQIGNPAAIVNGNEQQLLAAPELTENGFTVVPLRFISETFGAEVGYDESTERITVVKEKLIVDENQGIAEGGIRTKKIGDSYYNWSMDNPVDTWMERSFDGTKTTFHYDDKNSIKVEILKPSADMNFDKIYLSMQELFKDSTLIKAEKNAAKQYMHFQGKSASEFEDMHIYMMGGRLYVCGGVFDVENTKIREEAFDIIKTFRCYYTGDDIHDLSDAEEGMRHFESKEMKISFDIPADFYRINSENVINVFEFARLHGDDNVSNIKLGIYSKSEDGSAKDLAEKDFQNNKNGINGDLAKFGAIVQKQYSSVGGYEYSYTVNASEEQSQTKDMFFELGDYVYNVRIKLKGTDDKEIINKILDSITADVLDADEVGLLKRNIIEYEGSRTIEGAGWSLEVPNEYDFKLYEPDDIFLLSSRKAGIYIYFEAQYGQYASMGRLEQVITYKEDDIKEEAGEEVIRSTMTVMKGRERYVELIWSVDDPLRGKLIKTIVSSLIGECWVYFEVIYPELAYSDYNIEQVEKMITSLKLE